LLPNKEAKKREANKQTNKQTNKQAKHQKTKMKNNFFIIEYALSLTRKHNQLFGPPILSWVVTFVVF